MNNFLAMEPIQAGPFVFVMGLLIVFFGIGIIVAVISIIGMIMKRSQNRTKKVKNEQPAAPTEPIVSATDDEEENRVRAAIVAVLTAYYFNQGSNCEFKIKKIKRL